MNIDTPLFYLSPKLIFEKTDETNLLD